MHKMLFLILYLAYTMPALGQEKPRRIINWKRNFHVNASKPSVYITFDHVGKRRPLYEGESDQGVWLRVHNNTLVSMLFFGSGVPKDDGEIGMNYDLVSTYALSERINIDPSGSDAPPGVVPVGRPVGHVGGTYLLRPGKSVLFSVPHEDLPARVALRLPFNYEWELQEKWGPVRRDEPTHYVLFYSSAIPQ